ncbi:MAG: hypothetical protein A4E41_01669 [Methanoregulaceae archaeon PtaU1.Bin066]|nr:MAG: hypothetical protein A4E41_01669 [Methanoregulaceae archaeon PtaU1.Bin066]
MFECCGLDKEQSVLYCLFLTAQIITPATEPYP